MKGTGGGTLAIQSPGENSRDLWGSLASVCCSLCSPVLPSWRWSTSWKGAVTIPPYPRPILPVARRLHKARISAMY